VKTLRRITLAAVVTVAAAAAAAGCSDDKSPQSGNMGVAGITGAGGSGSGGGGSGGGSAANTIKLETWMDGIAKNAEVDVNAMPDNVLFTVTDKRPVSAAEAAAVPAEAGKLTVVYDEDPAALRFLFEADPRFQAQ
jgi:hypothetical protein